MRHLKAGRKLSRNAAHRKALMRNLVTSLIHYERITTTEAKAKEMRSIAERTITLAKRGTLHDRLRALCVVRDKACLKKLFDVVGPRYAQRPGGYTRIYKLESRPGDNAPQAIIELVDGDYTAGRKVKEAKS